MIHLHIMMPLANFGSLFGFDGLVVFVIGLLLFGRKLPEVCKNLRRTATEFHDLGNQNIETVLLVLMALLIFLMMWAKVSR